ncbi:PaaX family transcriptional regulator [Actinomadura pelletieri DSM 43383]|uniref:PaaX family transcriptional regulator n=1 Tax=Actinomadura pelletieri DSM 43383 TaxID=1120940 RepID=A0A495QXK2_9ACTN|nr:PaaX family transcriptional regulator C-terminal domain-containing protein [Actinomadura pelletieri]RKS78754.1 PaaX family transcriptional regulator [Actinomadura pelletieri DSM 43383]
MKPRSLVFDLFGDYLRYRDGEVRLRGLVALMECFGVPESTTRVVATRMRKEGWLDARREGRETVYALTDAAWRLLDEGRERIFVRERGPWDGNWHMVVYSVPEADRALRERLRKRLSWLGFGPLASAVWISPHDRSDQVREGLDGSSSIRLDVLRARSEGAAADRDMASRAWDLDALDADYGELLGRYRPRIARYRADDLRGAEALVERTRLTQDYRQFPFRDPDLPPELLPEGWRGRAAHEVFLEAHGLLRAEAQAHVDHLLT